MIPGRFVSVSCKLIYNTEKVSMLIITDNSVKYEFYLLNVYDWGIKIITVAH